jgi:hypothetical protein
MTNARGATGEAVEVMVERIDAGAKRRTEGAGIIVVHHVLVHPPRISLCTL